jgi:hypothetical protein
MSRRGGPTYDANAVLAGATDRDLSVFANILRGASYLRDPITWMSECPGAFAWSKQVEIAYSVLDHRHTAVRSCHDSGKSFIAAHLACWWIATHAPGEAFVITSAPTMSQVRSILWREIHKAHAAGGLIGQLNQTEWSIGKELVAIGRKPADYDEAAFQGIHARFVLVILDEASGIPPSLWTAAETLIANEDSRVLAIGNPDDPNGAFAKVCRPNSGWNVIGISAFDTPNFTEEEVPAELRPLLISPTWVQERRARWGEGSPLWISKVEGEFPDRSDDSLIPLSWVERARERELQPGEPVQLGVDVARFGSSETVIVLRKGPVARVIHAEAGQDTMQTTGAVIQAMRNSGADIAKVDDVGVGGGVLDRLKEQRISALGVGAGRAPTDPRRFANARAECYWYLRELFEKGEITIDPDDEVLAEQLCSIRYSLNSRGLIQIESKEDMRARGVASPDRADGLMLVFAPVDVRQRARVLKANIR